MDQPILTTTILLQVHTKFHSMEVNAVHVARILQTPVNSFYILTGSYTITVIHAMARYLLYEGN